jgi:branched-chain amino acid aminotransferase
MNDVLTSGGWITAEDYRESFWEGENSVYEVIRMIDGVPLFMEDHFERLLVSAKLQALPFGLSPDKFRVLAKQLSERNFRTEGNIKFVCFDSNGQLHWAFRFIKHSYPTPEEYLKGVATGWLAAERRNPNAKVFQNSVRSRANEMMTTRNLYEVLLVDRNGMITEGSRSNVFFVKAGAFYTAPQTMVLVGITRQKVIDCIKSLNFEVIEKAVGQGEIGDFDAAVITGTSPKVLPIRSIGDLQFNVNHPEVRNLMDRYNQLIDEYIGKAKKE